MKIMIVGDTHGGISEYANRKNQNSLVEKINKAGEMKIQHVIVVGDFGLWTHRAEGHEFLDSTNAAAEANNLSVYALPGNHENHDHWEWFVDNMATSKGMAFVRRRVLLIPKVHKWTWAGKAFVVAGGAVSIDKAWRLAQERGGDYNDPMFGWSRGAGKGTGHKTLWWPNEELTDQDVKKVQSMGWNADYLLTHDCSNHTQFNGRLKPDPDSERHRRRIDEVIAATNAKMHFHGHMHDKYDWVNTRSHGYYSNSAFGHEHAPRGTRTYGLRCNDLKDSFGILNVETNTFVWESDLP